MAFKDPHANIETIPLKQRGAFARWRKIQLTPISDRFWRKVSKQKRDECWPWIGNINTLGYGIFSPWGGHRGREVAHRAAWRFTNGEIPEGLYICHKCDNPCCCNPKHLFPGTQFDNMRDCRDKGRCNPKRGEESVSAKLTERQVVQMRIMYRPGVVSMEAVGKLFGVSKSQARQVIRRMDWKHVA